MEDILKSKNRKSLIWNF